PVFPVAVLDSQGEGTAERPTPPHTRGDVRVVSLDLHAAAAPVTALTPREVGVDIRFGEGESGGEAFDDGGQALTVGFTRGEEPERPAHRLLLSAGRPRREGAVGLDQRRREEHDQLTPRLEVL